MNGDVCPYCEPGSCPVEYGNCHCGCGQPTERYIHERSKFPAGTPQRWIVGHWNYSLRKTTPQQRAELERRLEAYETEGICPWCGPGCPAGAGYCHCGCGDLVEIADRNDALRGLLAGMPRKVRQGHAPNTAHLTRDQVRELRYVYATTDITQDALAVRYGISQGSLSKILRYEHYADAGIATAVQEAS